MTLKQKMVSFIVSLAVLSFPAASALATTTIGNDVSVGGTLAVTGAATLSTTLTVTGLATLSAGFISSASSTVNAGLQVSGNLSVSSTLTLAGNILPSANNSVNLGAYGSAFQNVYVSSSLFMASSTVFNGSISSTVYLSSGNVQAGGRIVMKAANGATCYQLYFGDVGGGVIGIATSTIACPNQ